MMKRSNSGFFKRAVSMLLTSLMVFSVPLETMAAFVSQDEETGQLYITDENGNVTAVDETWETRFPYGTFAFGESQLVLKEGEETEVKLTLYRLGGTKGRAEADVVFMPASAELDNGKISYVNAAGNGDYNVSLELPQPIAEYQPLGGSEGYTPSELYVELDAAKSVDNTVDRSTGEVLEYGEQQLYVPAPGSSVGMPWIDGVAAEADSYRWQLRKLGSSDSQWEDIDGAESSHLVISNELFWSEEVSYDYRCIYTVDGVEYCSVSYLSEEYVPPIDDIPEIPEGFENDLNPGFTDVELTGDEYDVQMIEVVFADGEETKEIVFSVNDDDLHEAEEFILINILEARGATLYDSANTITLRIDDDEEQLPSYVSFADAEVSADKADGSVRLTVVREGGIQYAASVEYEITGITAKAGRDYAGTSGEAYFAPGMDETYIDIELIQDGDIIEPEDGLTAGITLTGVKGGGGSAVTEGGEYMTLVLYNTEQYVDDPNLATILHSSGAHDISAEVEVAESSIVGGTQDEIEISAVSTENDELVGEILTGKTARSYGFEEFSHGGVLKFKRSGFSRYSENYWTDWESVVESTGPSYSDGAWDFVVKSADNYDKEDSTKHVDYEWKKLTFGSNEDESIINGDEAYGTRTFLTADSGQRVLEHNGNVSGRVLTIPDSGKLYDEVYMLSYMSNYGYDRYDKDDELALLPYVYLDSIENKSIVSNVWSGSDLNGEYKIEDGVYKVYTDLHYRTKREDSAEISINEGTLNLEMGLLRYSPRTLSVYTGSNNAYSTTALNLAFLQFHRRYFENDFKVLVHTANDEDVVTETVGGDAAVLSAPGGYQNLFPTISIVQNSGGVTEAGDKLYTGTKLRVAMGNSASFDPADGTNGSVVFLTQTQSDGSSKVVAVGSPAYNSDGSQVTENGKLVYYLTLMWDGMTEDDLSAEYTINVAMTRKQTIVVNFVPSIGDLNPPYRRYTVDDAGNQSVQMVWEDINGYTGTEIKGNLLTDFDSTLVPISIRESILGSNVPVVSKGITANEDGSFEIDDTAKSILNKYLGSLNSDDTFGISVREVTVENGSETVQRFETSAGSGLTTFPDASVVTAFSGSAGNAEGDPGESGNPMGEFNIDTGVELPTFNFGLTDYVGIIMDGYEVGFSIGVPLYSTSTKFKKEKDASGNRTGDKNEWKGDSNPKEANADALSDIKEMFTGKDTPASQYDKIKQKAQDAKDAGHSLARSKSFSVDVGFNLTIMFKYNPLDNGYYFSQASFLVSCGLGFTFTVRLTVCPVIFAYFSVGMEINAGASINADRVKSVGTTVEVDVSGNNNVEFNEYKAHIAEKNYDTISEVNTPDAANPTAYYYTGHTTLGPGSNVKPSGGDFVQLSTGGEFAYITTEKAFDITFRGRLQVVAYEY